MDTLEGMRPWARDVLSALTIHFHFHRDEISELIASGIAQHTIDSLYPFEINEWNAAAIELSFSKESHRADARTLVPSFEVLQDLSGCLSLTTASAGSAWAILAELSSMDHAPSTRVQRILITALLLHALSDNAQEVLAGSHRAWVGSARMFKRAVEEFRSALDLTIEAITRWKIYS